MLQKGDTVGVVSLASFLPKPDVITCGLKYLNDIGLKYTISSHAFGKYHYMAGTAEERAQDLMDMYTDTRIKAIIDTCGGAGSQMILDYLDYDIIKNNPKPLIGLSDITSVQNAIIAKTGVSSYTGFLLKYSFKLGCIEQSLDFSFKKTFMEKDPLIINNGNFLNPGTAEGILIGGNLTCFCNLCGTSYFPELTDSIILIEEIAEEPYKINRMLTQLQQQKNFNKVKAVIFGSFTKCIATNPEDGTVNDIIKIFAKTNNIPIVSNFSYGHISKGYILPLGKKVKIEMNKENGCRLIAE